MYLNNYFTHFIKISALPEPPHVRAAVEGNEGILSGLSEGKIWMDHSTTDPNQTLVRHLKSWF